MHGSTWLEPNQIYSNGQQGIIPPKGYSASSPVDPVGSVHVAVWDTGGGEIPSREGDGGEDCEEERGDCAALCHRVRRQCGGVEPLERQPLRRRQQGLWRGGRRQHFHLH